ncbi:DUF6082 family protein [Phytohabitans sp. ZYX-F-186]|uniref:DUF6082 family protein n=1 Tax=Phytohabitans maris TaxID=3071409 RepID=A0ABU0ZN47_9ACTN|nr:DUF6082 family protein [Phytohabitans sp. ZYX-F-186]MDQ7908425.1 DUF6082 family protein [Phytohabitans sp. ZYX-F-186]
MNNVEVAIRTGKWISVSVLVVLVILLVGLGAVSSLQSLDTPGAWAERANVGDSFGVVNAVVSGLALAALIVTLWLQSRELALQRAELAMQRESLNQSRVELHRSAEASLRMLHVDLIRMSIDDPSLAEVWPPLAPGVSHERERQYLYANLIYQHVWLGLRISDYTDEQMQNHLRYIFTSSLMREYWRAAARARTSLVPGTAEYAFAEAADRICGEYEDLLAASRSTDLGRETESKRWERLDSEVPFVTKPSG